MIRFIIGTLAMVGIIAGAIVLEGGHLGAYLMPTSGGIAVFVPLFAALAVWPFREWLAAWRDAFAKGESATAARSAAIWDFQEKASYAAGVIGPLAGAILMLSQLNAVEKIGPAVAVALTSPLYALILGLVCRILRARVERKRT